MVLQLALQTLEAINSFAPREASVCCIACVITFWFHLTDCLLVLLVLIALLQVHFLMGRIQKRTGALAAAARSLQTALDLDPKDRNLVKAAIDSLFQQGNDNNNDDEF